MISGRIIRILSSRRVIINVGSDDGVKSGQVFGIFTPSDEITDPQTHEVLGSYRARKASIRAVDVQARFTVCVAHGTERRRVREDPPSPIYGFSSLRSRKPVYEEVPATLDIDFDAETPMPTGETVSIGDLVEAPDAG